MYFFPGAKGRDDGNSSDSGFEVYTWRWRNESVESVCVVNEPDSDVHKIERDTSIANCLFHEHLRMSPNALSLLINPDTEPGGIQNSESNASKTRHLGRVKK